MNFETFNNGKLLLPEKTKLFGNLPWIQHPTFEGVALKHLITAQESDNLFSFHLVRIDPQQKIGLHVHPKQWETHEIIAGNGFCLSNGKRLAYEPGIISIFPKNLPHEVIAGKDGLYLFAKFLPAAN